MAPAARFSGNQVQTQEMALEKAQLDNDRISKLFASGAASAAERDNTAIQLKSAIAQRDTIKEQLDELKNGSRSEELEQAQARALEAQSAEKLVKAGSRVEDIKAAQGAVEAAQGKFPAMEADNQTDIIFQQHSCFSSVKKAA